MNADVVLYSHRLKDAGYRMGYVGKWHASWVRCPADFGYEMSAVQGCDPAILRKYDLNLDRIDAPRERLKATPLRTIQWPGANPVAEWGYHEGPVEAAPEWHVAESAIRMLRRFARESRPWLLETHFVQPHDPYFPLKQYFDGYDPRSISVPTSFHDTFVGKPGLHRRESSIWGSVTEADYRQGPRLLLRLHRATRPADRAHAVCAPGERTGRQYYRFTTDHGDMVGNHRMWIKGWIPYEETYRVPLIVRWPGHVRPGSKTDRLVQTHDLAHTYVEAASAPPLPFRDGRALQPLFDAPAARSWPDQIMCAYYGGEFLYTQRIGITQRFKYVFNGFDIDEMYDLDRDPEEMRNVVEDADYAKYTDDMRAPLRDDGGGRGSVRHAAGMAPVRQSPGPLRGAALSAAGQAAECVAGRLAGVRASRRELRADLLLRRSQNAATFRLTVFGS
jgi:arylsulfatase A-like enzyme